MSFPEAITRLNAALSGTYAVERELGEGGMATVYLAEDLKHERKVALKLLKPELAAVVGAERFLTEIKTTAKLQHPHVLAVHDSGEADGLLFYVMPYIAGESLRERLDRERQLPVDEAISIATQMAEGLDYAHRQGVIHRDIKPANVLLQHGKPVIADFGIALAVSTAGGARMTETGLSLGTPYYMSPEQASADREASPASDVYSLGCVLYEMLVGEPPHVASSAQAVLAKILTDEAPSSSAARPSVPANVDAALRRALERLPADRFTRAQDFAMALRDPGFQHGRAGGTALGAARPMWNGLTTAMAGMAVLCAGVAIWSMSTRPTPQPDSGLIRFDVPVPSGHRMGQGAESPALALAPDGRTLVYIEDGVLMTLDFEDEEPVRLEGTEGAEIPFFSPDGGSLGFFQDGELRRTPVGGGAVTRLLDLTLGTAYGGADWAQDGTIFYGRSALGIWRASVGDTVPRQVTVPDRDAGENVHHWPQALEGGRLLLFSALGASGKWRDAKVILVDVETNERWVVVEGGAQGSFVPPGHIVYANEDGTLLAQSFDLDSRSPIGEPLPVETGVRLAMWGGAASFAVSDRGDLAFVRGDPWTRNLLVWFDRAGNRLSQLGDPVTASWGLEIEPGGSRIATALPNRLNDDIWLLEEEIAAPQRVTSDPAGDGWPVWSPDGTRIAWQQDAPIGDQYPVMVVAADGSGSPTVLYQNEYRKWPTSWSPDGRWLIASERWPATGLDLYAIDVVEGTERITIADSEAGEEFGRISPDGRWVAYVSDETGSREVHVVSFPDVGEPRQVTRGGGEHPRWSGDSELVFWQGTTLMSARLRTEPSFAVEEIQPLFDVPDFSFAYGDPRYAVTPGGERFLIKVINPDSPARAIHVALHWGAWLGEATH